MKKKLMTDDLLSRLETIKNKVFEVLCKQKDNVLVINTVEQFEAYITACIEDKYIAVDTETNNSIDPLTCKIMGLCLYSPNQKQAYVPINHRNPITKERLEGQLTEKDICEQLKRVIEAKTFVIMHNGKFDYEVLKCTCGVELFPNWDTMICASLLNENERHGLKEQYRTKIDSTQEKYDIEKLFSSYDDITYADIDPSVFGIYSATDSYMTYKLYEYQRKLLESDDNKRIKKLFLEIEMPMVVISAEMELLGARADVNYSYELKKKYETLLEETDKRIENELTNLQPVIDYWKNSDDAQQREIIYPIKTGKRNDYAKRNFEEQFPYLNDRTGERFKLGKKKIYLISNPIKLSSPKQLSILFYEIFGAKPVKSKSPLGTGSRELELLKSDFLYLRDCTNLLKKGVDEDGEEIDQDKLEGLRERHFKKYKRFILNDSTDKYAEIKKYIKCITNLCDLLLERREIEKLITTYLNVVPGLAKHWDDGKIRFHLNSLGARTGRFSSGGDWRFLVNDKRHKLSGMNSQNLPSKNHEIRLMFKADEGRVFVGGDFGQQEPKITAFLSQDAKMLSTFRDTKDIYAIIAQSVLGNKYEDNLEFFDKEKTKINLKGKENRSLGKVVILAIMYGMGPGGLAAKTGKSNAEAKDILDKVFEEFSAVKKAIDVSQENCFKYGYVEGLLGRRRHLPDIQKQKYEVVVLNTSKAVDNDLLKEYLAKLNSGTDFLDDNEFELVRKEALKNNILVISNEVDIEKAKRQCFNAKIQGSAATMTKKTMILIHNDQTLRQLGAHMVFQIHDELIMECPIENSEKVRDRLEFIMKNSVNALGITIPMKCDMVIEKRWGEDAMTEELKVEYEKLKEKNKPIENLYGMFPNFPKESIKRAIEGTDKVIKF